MAVALLSPCAARANEPSRLAVAGQRDRVWGHIVGPVWLMLGPFRMPASSASLLLNAEAVLTAALAGFAFKENVERRIALGRR